MIKLVSFLGTGLYGLCTYTNEYGTAQKTRYMACVAAELYKVDIVSIIMTSEAKTVHGDNLEEEFEKFKFQPFKEVCIKSGKNQDELWDAFDKLKHELRFGLDEKLTSNDTVVVDITHGFRSQPFFAAAVLMFLKSVDTDAPKIKVVYGAWEARTGGLADPSFGKFVPKLGEPEDAEAPVWDLTPFIELLDWSNALHLFLKTGRPRGLESLESFAPDLVKSLTLFGDDLITGRTGSLLLGTADRPSSSKLAYQAVTKIKENPSNNLQPLKDVLERVEKWLKPLQYEHQDLAGEKAKDAIVSLARLYLELERYFEVMGTVKEGSVSLEGTPEASKPGSLSMDDKKRLKESLQGVDIKSSREARNDLMHMGYKQKALTPAEIKQEAINALEKLQELNKHQKKVYTKGAFVNLSNHPSEGWPKDQIDEALRISHAPIIKDLPFPDVDAGMSSDELVEQAKKIAGKAKEKCKNCEPKIVMVQGDFTFSWLVIQHLKAMQITCVAATTKRIVEQDGQAKRSYFQFVRFREYL